jgi:hypothetical protein
MKRVLFALLVALFAFGLVFAQDKSTTKETQKATTTETTKTKMSCCEGGSKGCCKKNMKCEKSQSCVKGQKKTEKPVDAK